MARKSDLRTMTSICEIRGMQRAASEAQLARAVIAAKEAAGERERCAGELLEAERGWSASLAGCSFDLSIPVAWAGEVRRREIAADLAQDDDRKAAEATVAAKTSVRARMAEEAAAERLSLALGRQVARRLEEEALAEVADRIARSGGRR